MSEIRISPITETDKGWLRDFFLQHWGGATMVYGHGSQVFSCDELPGFVAWVDEKVAGLITYHESDDAWQVVSLDSLHEGLGIGTALMKQMEQAAREKGVHRIWLLTTNDNLNALRFYQKRGYELVAIHRCALEKARKLKPSIPLIGNDGIPLQDELELEKKLER